MLNKKIGGIRFMSWEKKYFEKNNEFEKINEILENYINEIGVEEISLDIDNRKINFSDFSISYKIKDNLIEFNKIDKNNRISSFCNIVYINGMYEIANIRKDFEPFKNLDEEILDTVMEWLMGDN